MKSLYAALIGLSGAVLALNQVQTVLTAKFGLFGPLAAYTTALGLIAVSMFWLPVWAHKTPRRVLCRA
jgi:hypothetical protein